MLTRTVFGEQPKDVGAELTTLDFGASATDGWVRVEGRIEGGGPLMRALLRAEAELLLDEAAAMAAGRWTPRDPGERRADAFVLVAERLSASLAGGGANATGSRPAGRRSTGPPRSGR
jgi:hypothetical protein